MTLKECYEQMHGDYEGVVSRLSSDRLVERFALKFLNDPSFSQLKEAMEAGDGEAAFRASHTLKGICLNLGFSALYEASSALTEKLRDHHTIDASCDGLYAKTAEEYERTIRAIESLAH